MADYNGKNAVTIGGTHGIGSSTAQILVSGGARAVITGCSAALIESAKSQLGPPALVLQSSITSLSALSSLQFSITQHFGTGPCIDFLFISAGHASLEPIDVIIEESFDKTFLTQMCVRLGHLVKDGGSIVFTTSVANGVGIPGMVTYSAAKAAVRSFAQTFAAELSPRDIRVNAVSPGFVKTPTMGVAGASERELEAFEKVVKTTPLSRIASAEEIAKLVIFIGLEGTFVTGTEVIVDGGLSELKIESH